ncbi:MAG: AAA family ATPase, partial [Thermoanaerobaculia bacterium]|nr:AAA family ATPase [Thermoanaerobaculia bacterium]
MFKLDHLEISGFKSFVDPVSVKFTGTLNAIVGPNGCGKSNVSDAVTWVLGERSAKSLRASQMSDVIFNGSAGRKPLGMAEVSLTLLADPSVEQAEDGKLTIGRRLYRSGESQYLINGKVERLKDVRDLLMGTGLGIRAYSVIEQGKIDAILSGKPQDRRRLLEEAAGITKYKERKRLAELKLEEARANLARIDDIVSEVERSLRSLKRQANAARRYGERRAKHDERLEKVLLKRWHALQADLGAIESTLAEKTTREAELVAELHSGEAAIESGRESVDELAESYAELRRRESELVATIEGKQQLIKGSRQLLDEIAERLESGEATAAQRRAELDRLASSRQSFEEIHASTSSATEDAARAVSETDRLTATTDQAVADAEATVARTRSELLASLSAVNSLKNEIHRLEVES